MNVQTNETDPPLSAICASNIMSSPKTSVDLQQVFSRFETFNFDNDQKFQAGLDKINRQASASKGKEHAIDMLKIKLFYYSRNVEPVDVAAYMEWRKGCGRGESPVTSEGHATEAGSSSHPQRSRDNVMCQVNENFICKKSNCPQSDDNQTEHGQLSGGDADKEPGNRSSYGGQSSDSPPCQDPSPCLCLRPQSSLQRVPPEPSKNQIKKRTAMPV
ncbi:uncharacterized protein LOC143295096 [Babylonia areolata]|uniref:uncharacterized protein LOC143295096 n=1 Tax=Babylonia areolata TaxID=304850 RepID=UPI003FD168DF